ncbi:sterol desaturase family protein [Flavobacteriaceae bacterium D16]|nr:sterol desaturase family protein [Flavobacteriaceae bacterium D16]
MELAIWLLIFIATFCIMEFMAWFTHKYIMHGFLWVLHKDHHKKDHDSWFERNDAFFLYYAAMSMAFIIIASNSWFWYGYPIGFGIMAYGAAYFLVHDIFIHQRFKMFRKANNWYARGVRRAHKIHHKHLGKKDGECFGMLVVPFKYFKRS